MKVVRTTRRLEAMMAGSLVLGAGLLFSSCAASTPALSPLNRDCLSQLEASTSSVAGEDVVPPRVIHRASPVVPLSVINRANPADVSEVAVAPQTPATVEVLVGPDGVPQLACVSGGDYRWGAAVAQSAMLWRFEPATVNGLPVPARFQIKASRD